MLIYLRKEAELELQNFGMEREDGTTAALMPTYPATGDRIDLISGWHPTAKLVRDFGIEITKFQNANFGFVIPPDMERNFHKMTLNFQNETGFFLTKFQESDYSLPNFEILSS